VSELENTARVYHSRLLKMILLGRQQSGLEDLVAQVYPLAFVDESGVIRKADKPKIIRMMLTFFGDKSKRMWTKCFIQGKLPLNGALVTGWERLLIQDAPVVMRHNLKGKTVGDIFQDLIFRCWRDVLSGQLSGYHLVYDSTIGRDNYNIKCFTQNERNTHSGAGQTTATCALPPMEASDLWNRGKGLNQWTERSQRSALLAGFRKLAMDVKYNVPSKLKHRLADRKDAPYVLINFGDGLASVRYS
jgi:hypothetical protein